jgi:uncharacterized protein YjlB
MIKNQPSHWKSISLEMTGAINIRPLESLKVSTFQVPAHAGIPNTSIQGYPLLIYRQSIGAGSSAVRIENHLKGIGAVTPQWRYTMYSTSHFHSTSHEVLCISRGKAELLFGGEDNPDKIETTVEEGDVIVIPAGVSHRLVKDMQGNFEMVGSYPPGYNWDMCYGKQGEEKTVEKIKNLEWFKKDPIYGEEGPVLDYGVAK